MTHIISSSSTYIVITVQVVGLDVNQVLIVRVAGLVSCKRYCTLAQDDVHLVTL